MLSVIRVHLPSDIPIVGCELSPYVLLKRPDKSVISDDVTEFNPIDGHFLRYKWYRVQSDRKVAVCSVHPTEQATLQCLGCVKAKISFAKSYHCSPKCFSDAWQHHRVLHERAASAVNENGNEEEEIDGRFNSTGSNVILPTSQSNPSLSNGTAALYPVAVAQRNGGETWFEVGYYKTYTPTADDIGHVLKFECVVVDAETKLASTALDWFEWNRCSRNLDLDGRISSVGTFTVLSYNILSDAYAASELYSYCPSWALSWAYRRQNLLREIIGYHADIVCLQEVQSDHFEEFFAPELDKHGYQALFKRKTAEVEFNKAAQSLTDALVPSAQKHNALNRLVKDNVALIVVLEAKFSSQGIDNPGKRQLVCVVHTLLKGLEKIAASADIPMLVCGDFNSVPGSAPHALLAMGKVDPLHPDLAIDPLGILRPTAKLTHQLPLAAFGYVLLADSLTVESLLELLDEDSLRKDTALPSPEWSSDHIALLAEFRCKPRTRR
ncbi:hypothetical protein DH2020_039427 [Rehmannia glutinosa]|uniref:Endonuclease/exonuclease/phosphatase domain-containing protein n=1 Tax=Rehmannia glutinosa TaxID=99300 RepID=A0ABR0UVY1_REHGL